MTETVALNEPLKFYDAAVIDAVARLGNRYGVWESRAYNTGNS